MSLSNELSLLSRNNGNYYSTDCLTNRYWNNDVIRQQQGSMCVCVCGVCADVECLVALGWFAALPLDIYEAICDKRNTMALFIVFIITIIVVVVINKLYCCVVRFFSP